MNFLLIHLLVLVMSLCPQLSRGLAPLFHLHRRTALAASPSRRLSTSTSLFSQKDSTPPSSMSSSLPSVPSSATRVVLMRHGESEFNTANIFTGWCDVALTPRGVVEATEAGQVFLSNNIRFSCCYTSVLSRSIRYVCMCVYEIYGGARHDITYSSSP